MIVSTAVGGEMASPFTFMDLALIVGLLVFLVTVIVSMHRKYRLHKRYMDRRDKDMTLRPQLGAIVRRLGLIVVIISFLFDRISSPTDSLYLTGQQGLPYAGGMNGFAPYILVVGLAICVLGWVITRLNREYIKPTVAEKKAAKTEVEAPPAETFRSLVGM